MITWSIVLTLLPTLYSNEKTTVSVYLLQCVFACNIASIKRKISFSITKGKPERLLHTALLFLFRLRYILSLHDFPLHWAYPAILSLDLLFSMHWHSPVQGLYAGWHQQVTWLEDIINHPNGTRLYTLSPIEIGNIWDSLSSIDGVQCMNILKNQCSKCVKKIAC